MASIQELIQTEKNYIDNLKAINRFFTYLEKSEVKRADAETATFHRSMSVFTGTTFVELERPRAPLPQGLHDGKGRICFGNSREILDFHQRYVPA